MKVSCPHCKSQGIVDDKFAGRTAVCPKCKNSYTLESIEEKIIQWYYAIGKEKIGPMSAEDFNDLVIDGTITPKTLVWNKNLAQWSSFEKVAPEFLHEATASQGDLSTATCVECHAEFRKSEMFDHFGQLTCSKCKLKLLHEKREEEEHGGASEQIATGGLHYASPGLRGLAKIIDMIILGMLGFSIEFISDTFFPAHAQATLNTAFLTTLTINMLLGMFYITWFGGKFSATPGKIFCGMKIVTPEGENIGYGRAFFRYCGEFVVVALTFLVGYLIAFFDSENRALHDRICSTRVVSV